MRDRDSRMNGMTGASRYARRELLRRAAACACAGATTMAAGGSSLSALLTPARSAYAAPGRKFLVLLRLYGGNDGINTVIPFQQGTYYDARPTLAVPMGSALPISSTLAFHPRMQKLLPHFQAGRLAVVQSVGYSPPNLSHFRSEVIWQSADPVTINPTGWIGRYLDTLAPAGDPEVRAVNVTYGLDHVFLSQHANVFASPGVDSFYFPTDYFGVYDDNAQKRALFERICQEPRTPGSPAETIAQAGYVLSRNVDRYAAVPDIPGPGAGGADFPDSFLGRSFRETARLIASSRAGDIESGVFQVGIGGFDTHGEQDSPGGHPDLWDDISASLDAFHQELVRQGAQNDVIVVGWSEFGRRVEENGSAGTDHGTSAPMFAFGSPVTGGIYGPDPDLTTLDADGNLIHTIDFRQVYATILDRWLGADSQQILGGTYSAVPFLG